MRKQTDEQCQTYLNELKYIKKATTFDAKNTTTMLQNSLSFVCKEKYAVTEIQMKCYVLPAVNIFFEQKNLNLLCDSFYLFAPANQIKRLQDKFENSNMMPPKEVLEKDETNFILLPKKTKYCFAQGGCESIQSATKDIPYMKEIIADFLITCLKMPKISEETVIDIAYLNMEHKYSDKIYPELAFEYKR